MQRRTSNALRIVATLGVLCIHGAGEFEAKLAYGGLLSSSTGWQHYLAAVLSQLSRFSVPLFIVLSGYGLTASRLQRGEEGWRSWMQLWQVKGIRILLPFAVFTLFGLLCQHRLIWEHPSTWPSTFCGSLLRGEGDYHLYFCSFLLQGYVLLPLISRINGFGVILLLLLQAWLGRPGGHLHAFYGFPFLQLPAWALPHWLGYLALGCFLARRDHSRSEWPVATKLSRWSWTLATLFAGAWCVAEFLLLISDVQEVAWINHFFRGSVMIYSLCLLFACRAWATATEEAELSLSFEKLAGLGFCVYLIHTSLLRGWQLTPLRDDYLLLVLLLAFTSYGLAALAQRWLPGRWLRMMLGL